MRRNWQFRSQEWAFLRRQGTEFKHADRLVQPCQQKTYRGEHSPARQNSSFTILIKLTKPSFVYLHFWKCKYDQGESPRKSKKCENVYLFCCQGKNFRSSDPKNFLSIKDLAYPAFDFLFIFLAELWRRWKAFDRFVLFFGHTREPRGQWKWHHRVCVRARQNSNALLSVSAR